MVDSAMERFDAALRCHLDDRGYRFYSLRTRYGRIARAVDFLLRHADPGPGLVLNVGSAAFVLEFLLEFQRPWQFLSIDLETQYMPLYRDLCERGLLQRTRFMLMDIRQAEFADGAFRHIVAHDIFFTPSLELAPLLPKFARWLQPGGTLCFDVWDRAAKLLWQLAGRDFGLRRYDVPRLRGRLQEAGFRVLEEAPYFGNRGLVRTARHLLWTCGRVANARYLLAQKA